MTFLSTEGYFINGYPLSRGDRVLRFFTLHLGLVRVITNRRRIVQFPSLGCLITWDKAGLVLSASRDRDRVTMVESSLLERQTWMAGDLTSFSMSMLILETITQLLPEVDPHPAVFGIMSDYLDEARRGDDTEKASWHALFRIFGELGYQPDFGRCRKCGERPGGRPRFIPASGGFRHEKCLPGNPTGITVSPGTLLFLERLRKTDTEGIRRLKAGREIRGETGKVLNSYLNLLCQKRLHSQTFISKTETGGVTAPPSRK
jgi:DNA repair protein RecO